MLSRTIRPLGALALGAISSLACYYALQVKMKLGYDDSLDCFGVHGVGSGLGVLLLSFFIRDSWMQAAAANVAGWGAWQQFGVQLKGIGATIALAAIGTFLICLVVDRSIGFRIDKEGEQQGLDQSLHGESGYGLIFPESRL